MIPGVQQLAYVTALTGSGGVKTYVEDMNRISAVLQTAPPAFSWWTAVLLVLILLAWCAALTTAWMYLNRRIGKASDPGSGESVTAHGRYAAAPLRAYP